MKPEVSMLLQQIWQLCIIPLLAVLTKYIIQLISQKSQELQQEVNNKLYIKYMDLLTETVIKCVTATNQTYVESLKNKNIFDEAAQKEAFDRTYKAVMSILSQDAIEFLNSVVGDLDTLVKETIEAQVNFNKK